MTERSKQWYKELTEIVRLITDLANDKCEARWSDDILNPPAFLVFNKENNMNIAITYEEVLNIGKYDGNQFVEVEAFTDEFSFQQKVDRVMEIVKDMGCI